MKYYYAPLEGITDATFRRLHHKYFPGIDRYFMPFISPTIHRTLTHREVRELPRADSVSFSAVPQLLGKNVEDMLWAIEVCRDQGYDEVNINLGCPSGTVVSKGKGSGMLSDLFALDAFLDGLVDRKVLEQTLRRCEEELGRLQQQMEEEKARFRMDMESVSAFLQKELAGGEAVLDELVERVTVYPDHFQIKVSELPLLFAVRTKRCGTLWQAQLSDCIRVSE
jgi:hypothetical protein